MPNETCGCKIIYYAPTLVEPGGEISFCPMHANASQTAKELAELKASGGVGYSQQTVDAITKEREQLRAELAEARKIIARLVDALRNVKLWLGNARAGNEERLEIERQINEALAEGIKTRKKEKP